MNIPTNIPDESRDYLRQLLAHDDPVALRRAFQSKHFRSKVAQATGMSDPEVQSLAASYADHVATLDQVELQAKSAAAIARNAALVASDNQAIEQKWLSWLSKRLPNERAGVLADQVDLFVLEAAAIGQPVDTHLQLRCPCYVKHMLSRAN
jgi:hypothetical protein